MLLKKLKERKGEGYIDVAVIVIASMLVISLAINILPVFIVKDQLTTLSNHILREGQLQGKINVSYASIASTLGITPDSVNWTANTIGSNKVQFNEDITVTLKKKVDIGFGGFGSFPVKLQSKATGKSEVYWK